MKKTNKKLFHEYFSIYNNEKSTKKSSEKKLAKDIKILLKKKKTKDKNRLEKDIKILLKRRKNVPVSS